MAFNEKKYISDFQKETYYKYPFSIRKDDTEVLGFFQELPNKRDVLYGLLKEYMKRVTFNPDDEKRILSKYGISILDSQYDRLKKIMSILEDSSRWNSGNVAEYEELKNLETHIMRQYLDSK